MAVTGGGGSAEEYVVHQIEMVTKTLGVGACKTRAVQMGLLTMFEVAYDDERSATMSYCSGNPFTVLADNGTKPVWKQIRSDFFAALLRDIIRFYESGKTSFDVKETLEIMAIREASLKALNTPGEWVEL